MQMWLKGAQLLLHLLLALLVTVLLSPLCLISRRLKPLSAALLHSAKTEGYELPFSRLEARKGNRAEQERRIA